MQVVKPIVKTLTALAAAAAAVVAVVMSIGSAAAVPPSNAIMVLWSGSGFTGTPTFQYVGAASCTGLSNPGSVANTGNGTLTFYDNGTCSGVPAVVLLSGADSGNIVALGLRSVLST